MHIYICLYVYIYINIHIDINMLLPGYCCVYWWPLPAGRSVLPAPCWCTGFFCSVHVWCCMRVLSCIAAPAATLLPCCLERNICRSIVLTSITVEWGGIWVSWPDPTQGSWRAWRVVVNYLNKWMSAGSLQRGRDMSNVSWDSITNAKFNNCIHWGTKKNDCVLNQAFNGMLPHFGDRHILISIVITKVGGAHLESV